MCLNVSNLLLKYSVKAGVYLAIAYLLVVRAGFFAICTAKGLPQLF